MENDTRTFPHNRHLKVLLFVNLQSPSLHSVQGGTKKTLACEVVLFGCNDVVTNVNYFVVCLCTLKYKEFVRFINDILTSSTESFSSLCCSSSSLN